MAIDKPQDCNSSVEINVVFSSASCWNRFAALWLANGHLFLSSATKICPNFSNQTTTFLEKKTDLFLPKPCEGHKWPQFSYLLQQKFAPLFRTKRPLLLEKETKSSLETWTEGGLLTPLCSIRRKHSLSSTSNKYFLPALRSSRQETQTTLQHCWFSRS